MRFKSKLEISDAEHFNWEGADDTYVRRWSQADRAVGYAKGGFSLRR
jgi:hypothetical protein